MEEETVEEMKERIMLRTIRAENSWASLTEDEKKCCMEKIQVARRINQDNMRTSLDQR